MTTDFDELGAISLRRTGSVMQPRKLSIIQRSDGIAHRLPLQSSKTFGPMVP